MAKIEIGPGDKLLTGKWLDDIAVRERIPWKDEHCERTAKLCVQWGSVLGLDTRRIEVLRMAATLHDYGAATIPHIINKKGKLTAVEMRQVKAHPLIGANHVKSLFLPNGEEIAKVIYQHHEHWDGKGYPQGLKRDSISYLARILAIVDSVDAVRNDRPYRIGGTVADVASALVRNKGKMFDPDLAESFLRNISILLEIYRKE